MAFAYFDCFSGISGDMILGAMVDLGVPPDYLEAQVRALPLGGFRLKVEPAERMHIRGKKVDVSLDGSHTPAREYRDIRNLIENSSLPERVKQGSLKTFLRLAQVEAHIHNCSLEDVHFHELGALDTIVDVVGAFLGIEWLGIGDVAASQIPLGKGFVTCAHGRLPVPAPATVALLKDVPVYGTDIPHELTTPTGAAVITCLANTFGSMPGMRIQAIGYGAGGRDLEQQPNLLRVYLGERHATASEDSVTVVETNIDNMNPEVFGYVMERLFEDGALDVLWIPVFMKKNRPGTLMKVICSNQDREKIVRRILLETTATGVRHFKTDRTKLPRRIKEISTSFGTVQVKEIEDPTGRLFVVPEYEVCKKIALDHHMPLKIVYETLIRELKPKS